MTSPTTDRRYGLLGSVAWKAPVTALAAGNIVQSGEQVVDGKAVLAVNAAGVPDRVLCTGQTDSTLNGIWDVATGAWTRSPDSNQNFDYKKGSSVLVTDGNTYAGTYWQLTAAEPVTLGTRLLTWARALSGAISTLSFLQAGAGAVARGAQDKMRERVSIEDFGAVGDGVTLCAPALAAAKAALPNGGLIEAGPGTFNFGAVATGILLNGTATKQWKLRGAGGAMTRFKYTGAGDLLRIDDSAGTSILESVEGITLDLTGANAAANALHNSGAWRCRFTDFYITRDYVGGTGSGLLLDSLNGSFDVKVYNPYITNFGRNIKAVGVNLSAAAVTNFTVVGGYLSGGTKNVDISYALDVCFIGTQSELAVSDGIALANVNNFTWLGGAIEGSGGYGVNCGASVKGVTLCAGMFNNALGDINGAPLHYRRFSEAALDLIGEYMRVQRNGTSGTSYVSFWQNGVSDAKLGASATGNAFSLFDGLAADAERIKFDASNSGIDVLTDGGFFRVRESSAYRFLVGGIEAIDRAGNGTPEGVVTAPIGSTFRRINGGAVTTLYVKETGGGNTGWVAK